MSAIERRLVEEREAARWLGLVLRVGVFTASALVLFGLTLFFVHGNEHVSYEQGIGRNRDPIRVSLSSIRHGLTSGRPSAYIQLGVLALVLTPSLRVATTLILFARARERAFVLLAGVVLVVLMLGLVGIGA